MKLACCLYGLSKGAATAIHPVEIIKSASFVEVNEPDGIVRHSQPIRETNVLVT